MKKPYLVVAGIAILHNGKRYEQGDKISLTAQEAKNIALYVQLDADEEKRLAEGAEDARLAAEQKTLEPQNKENKKQNKESKKNKNAQKGEQ